MHKLVKQWFEHRSNECSCSTNSSSSPTDLMVFLLKIVFSFCALENIPILHWQTYLPYQKLFYPVPYELILHSRIFFSCCLHNQRLLSGFLFLTFSNHF